MVSMSAFHAQMVVLMKPTKLSGCGIDALVVVSAAACALADGAHKRRRRCSSTDKLLKELEQSQSLEKRTLSINFS